MIDFNKKFLLVSDIDFSFLGWDKLEENNFKKTDFIPDDNIKALKILSSNKNFYFSFATGSNPTKRIANIMRLIGMKDNSYAILNNGGLIVKFDLTEELKYEVIYYAPIVDGEDLLELAKPFSKIVKSVDKHNDDIVKIFLKAKDNYKELDSYKKFLKRVEKDRLTLHDYGEGRLDLTGSYGQKRIGVEKLRSILGIEKSQVIILGDGHNDKSMMSFFPNSFCPSDAEILESPPENTVPLKRTHREGCIMEIVEKIGFQK